MISGQALYHLIGISDLIEENRPIAALHIDSFCFLEDSMWTGLDDVPWDCPCRLNRKHENYRMRGGVRKGQNAVTDVNVAWVQEMKRGVSVRLELRDFLCGCEGKRRVACTRRGDSGNEERMTRRDRKRLISTRR